MVLRWAPTPAQRSLLRAACARDERDALAAWRACPGALDAASRRVLPLVYHNLRGHAEVAALAPLYRRTSFANGLLLARLAEVVGLLAAAGIETLVLKGAALLATVLPEPGTRPMSDLDVLVRFEHAARALTVLRDAGFAPMSAGAERLTRVRHACGLADRAGLQIDLHWHLLYACCERDADAAFWRDAVPARVLAVATRTLSPAHTLLHLGAHGFALGGNPVRALADATWVARAPVDWDVLVTEAHRCELGLPLATLLANLGELDVEVPPGVVAALADAPASWVDRTLHAKALGERVATPTVLLGYLRWRRRTRGEPDRVGPLRYLQYALGVERLRGLPPVLLARARQQLGLVAASRE